MGFALSWSVLYSISAPHKTDRKGLIQENVLLESMYEVPYVLAALQSEIWILTFA